MKLSVIMPVYNEEDTIQEIVKRVLEVPLDKELLIVDDCSRDKTPELLKTFVGRPEIKVLRHEKNQGKGAAIRTGIQAATGDMIIIQDADLEYDPQDFLSMLKAAQEKSAEVVFGNRFMGLHTGLYFWNALGNIFLTFVTNFLYNSWISDMETCYKLVKRDILRSLNLKNKSFDIEPEITAKLLKRRSKIYEIPVSYCGRTYQEGKKIRARDGLIALYTLIKYRFMN